MPLLISHGWPGSIVEFLDIIEKLAHPERFRGKEEDAFDVIAPSLPGYGFSGRPSRPMGPRKMADIFNKLMTKNLGYKNYLAQGGDWGATISNWLSYDHSKTCSAIHINCLTMRHPDGPQTKEEKDWETKFVKDQIMQDGYRTQQATKPQTLSYGMMDSPVGVAAWIIEKFYFWSDIKNNDIESVYSKDTLLANIMVYIVTKTFNTATWIYYGRREEGGRFFPKDFRRIEVPTAAALFPAEMSAWPPRSYVNRMFNIKRWTKMPKGGHFAALEQPDLLVDDIRAFARTLR
jgi:microsomal epoxide hydrolase